MRYQKNIFFFILIFFFISIYIKAEFIIPEKPKKIYPVNDFAKVLTFDQILFLNKKLIFFNKKKSIEILISIIDSINGEDVSMIGTKWGEKWQIGQNKESNGIFILLVIKDKKISIQTGYGIEPYLTDILCKKIINQTISYIKKEEYYFAIKKIINIIFDNLKNYNFKKIKNINNSHYVEIYLVLILIILYIYLFLKKNNQHSSFEESVITPNISEYNNESNKDDSFDGFGGGGKFGGGGASDNW